VKDSAYYNYQIFEYHDVAYYAETVTARLFNSGPGEPLSFCETHLRVILKKSFTQNFTLNLYDSLSSAEGKLQKDDVTIDFHG